MCGIAILLPNNTSIDLIEKVTSSLSNRGPDYSGSKLITDDCEKSILLISSVLQIQGSEICQQPYTDSDGNILLWNGEVFNDDIFLDGSDTIYVANILRNCIPLNSNLDEATLNIVTTLSYINGPYAFIYFSSRLKHIFMGRDPFGRRSMLKINCNNVLIGFTSVSVPGDYEYEEVNVEGVYHFSMSNTDKLQQSILLQKWPYQRLRLGKYGSNLDTDQIGRSDAANLFLTHLTSAVSIRVSRCSQGTIGVLFSGGIDSVLLSAVLSKVLHESQTIDLINVTFVGDNDATLSPDRLASIAAYVELKALFPSRKFCLYHVDVSNQERQKYENHIMQLIQPSNTLMDLNIGTAFWFASRGVGYIREYSEDDLSYVYSCHNEIGRPLLRVGKDGADKGVGRFARNRRSKQEKIICAHAHCGKYAKDRCCGKYCGRCCFKHSTEPGYSCFVHKFAKLENTDISHPSPNIIENELYRGMTSSDTSKPLMRRSEARALLIGIGADEHLAGYGRHRSVFVNEGVEKLHAELVKDQERLWQRNLGRDDRSVSDHGREAWFPYIDERVIGFLQSLNLYDIADLSLGEGEGDKRILRDASKLIGLKECVGLVKRAIQFGTNIAKLTNAVYYGSNRKGKGEDII